MTSGLQRTKMEDGEKERIISSEIEPRVEAFGGYESKLWKERRVALKELTRQELKRLGQGLQTIGTLKETNSLIVKAIADSMHTRKAAKNKKGDDLDGSPATVDYN